MLFVENSIIIKLTYYAKEAMLVAEVYTVLSGKGGTGKTSLCAGIATALALNNQRVLCIDCAVGLRNLDIALGLTEWSSISFLEVCRGDYALEYATVHPVYPTLRFLTAPVNCSADSIDRFAFARMLDQAREMFDYIFLDAPAGIEAGFRLTADVADRAILVSNGDPASIRDAGRSAEELERMGTPTRLVVNRLRKKMFRALNMTVDDIMDSAGLPLLGIVPEDENVVLAAAFGQPLLGYADKGAASACRRIAQRLQGKRTKIRI